jgi:hypothetical protein
MADVCSFRQHVTTCMSLVGLIVLFLSYTTSAFSVIAPQWTVQHVLRRHASRRSGTLSAPLQLTQTDSMTSFSNLSGDRITMVDQNDSDGVMNGEPIHVESNMYDLSNDASVTINYSTLVQDGILPTADPAQVEFVTPDTVLQQDKQSEQAMLAAWMKAANANGNGHYPFAAMMQGSGLSYTRRIY